MSDIIIIASVIMIVYAVLVLLTSVVVTFLEYFYCTCKPSYPFTDHLPSNPVKLFLWPFILPLLLLELIYIITYCLIKKLRNSL